MIYFDYCSTTPIDKEVLSLYMDFQKRYFYNPNSIHKKGFDSKKIIQISTKQISNVLNCEESEIIYTSGATEANNLCIYGMDIKKDENIITTKIEHKSVLKPILELKNKGYKVIFLDVDKKGKVKEESLINSINNKTKFISIIHVNNEIGSIQEINKLSELAKKKNKRIIFHTDMAQSIGKYNIDLRNVDLATFSAHKFFGPKSSGILFKKSHINLKPLFYGGESQNYIRPGTLNAPLIAATAMALRKSIYNKDKYYDKVLYLRNKLINFINKFKLLKLTIEDKNCDISTPYIVHFIIESTHINSEIFLNLFSNNNIFIGARSACNNKYKSEENHILKALNINNKYHNNAIRICISHLSTEDEVNTFMRILDNNKDILKLY